MYIYVRCLTSSSSAPCWSQTFITAGLSRQILFVTMTTVIQPRLIKFPVLQHSIQFVWLQPVKPVDGCVETVGYGWRKMVVWLPINPPSFCNSGVKLEYAAWTTSKCSCSFHSEWILLQSSVSKVQQTGSCLTSPCFLSFPSRLKRCCDATLLSGNQVTYTRVI